MNKSMALYQIVQDSLDEFNGTLSVREMCAVAGVSRSGYYAWLCSAPKRAEREELDRIDFELILAAYKSRRYSKGAKGVYMYLVHMEPPVVMNLKKIRRLMKKYGLVCPIRRPNPYRQLAKALRTNHVAENLLKREFRSYGPRVVLLTDITYIPYNGIFVYLSTILDAYTKQILAYVVSDSLTIDLVLDTVDGLLKDHEISLNAETIIHSDQGCHYTSISFINLLKDKQLRQSMSRRGSCWDNAPQESFFGHMKDHIREQVKEAGEYKEVKAIVEGYIDYYNNKRYQWELAKLSPNEFYEFCMTGIYPIKILKAPEMPVIKKMRSELGGKNTER